MGEALHVASADGIGHAGNDDWDGARQAHQDRNDTAAVGQDRVRIELYEVRGRGADEVHVVAGPALVELHVDAGRPAALSQLLPEGTHALLKFRVERGGLASRCRPAGPAPSVRASRT